MDGNSVNTLTENSEVISGLLSVVSAIIYAVATAFAASVAIYGIKSWRKEFRGKRQIELAEDTLALFYEAKNAIIAIRSPLSYKYEGTTRKTVDNETPEQKQVKDQAYVAFERFKEREQVFNKLISLRYRFMAQIGPTEAEPFEEMRSILNKTLQAVRWLAVLWSKDISHYNSEKQKQHSETVRKYEAIFCEDGPEDETNKRLEKAVSDMEGTCRKIILVE